MLKFVFLFHKRKMGDPSLEEVQACNGSEKSCQAHGYKIHTIIVKDAHTRYPPDRWPWFSHHLTQTEHN